ncbi:retinoic acid receptor responder protein 2-like isoform X2 [Xenopus tropicalis]|uniref:Retinoic acid receptor responder protein 2 n=1 Tax=Xenopus tropicalis TaxID=8364 RepID=A0A8J1JUH6_XENTR|nr:retinoic acid receptor responder protein 2-like isoform X2 [Xenopus tropicalis]
MSRTWCLLGAMGFILAVTGRVPMSELSGPQNKAMSLTTENFYETYRPRNHFIVTSVLGATQEDLDGGIYVQLHLKQKQSNCRRRDSLRKECKPLRNGAEFSCFSCFWFKNNSDKASSKFIRCAQNSEQIGQWEEECNDLRNKGIQLPDMYRLNARSRRPVTEEEMELKAQ